MLISPSVSSGKCNYWIAVKNHNGEYKLSEVLLLEKDNKLIVFRDTN